MDLQSFLALGLVALLLILPLAFIACLILAIVRKKALWWTLTCVLAFLGILSIVFLFVGARSWVDASNRAEVILETNELTAGGGREVVCAEGATLMIVPSSWEELGPEAADVDASLSVGFPSRNQYIMLVNEWRRDFDEVPDLAMYRDLVVNLVVDIMPDVNIMADEEFAVAGALASRRLQIEFEHDGLAIHQVFYLVETEKGFHQLLMSCAQRNIESNLPLFDAMAGTFRLREAP